MTTEAQPQAILEQPGDPDIWRVLGRLEANQQTMMQRLDRLEDRMDRLLYFMVGIVIANIGAMAAGFWAVTAALSN